MDVPRDDAEALVDWLHQSADASLEESEAEQDLEISFSVDQGIFTLFRNGFEKTVVFEISVESAENSSAQNAASSAQNATVRERLLSETFSARFTEGWIGSATPEGSHALAVALTAAPSSVTEFE